MLQIRDEQIPAIVPPRPEFRARVAAHLRSHFPDAQALDAQELDEIIDEGRARASRYGIVSEQDVCKYLNLMFTFGRHFDEDPRLFWTAPLLGGATRRQPTLRINRLCRQALGQLHHANGLAQEPST